MGKSEPANFDAKAAEALTNYKKYLDLTDKSYDSRLRYATFLFYAKDFKTLEQETSELASLNQNDPKSLIVSRLRGYSAYENKNYPQSLQYMKDFFAKVKDTSRIISDDYMYLGKALMKDSTDKNNDSLGLVNVIKAVNMDSTKVEALAELAKSYYDAKNYSKAIATYTVVNRLNPDGKGSLYNYFYHAIASYVSYYKAYVAKTNPSKDILVKGDSSLAKLLKLAPSTLDAILYRARINDFIDDEAAPKGLKIPFYQQYLDSVETHVDRQTGPVKKNMVEAYNQIAGFASYKEDKEKAKLFWDKSLAIDPSNATALEGIKSLTAPAPKTAAKPKKK
ncbi:tetratricopeptide repeat protein [Pedobacter steynii]